MGEGQSRKGSYMDTTDAMMGTVNHIIKKHFGRDADEIGRIRNITNHSVYFFTVAGDCYFLKLYKKVKNGRKKERFPLFIKDCRGTTFPVPK